MPLDRCPTAIAPFDGEADRAIDAYYQYLEGHLPSVGGMSEQSHVFVEMLPLLTALKMRHAEIETERAKPFAERFPKYTAPVEGRP